MKKEGPSISTINLGRIEKTKTNLIKEKGCLRLEDRRRSKKETKKKKRDLPTQKTEKRKFLSSSVCSYSMAWYFIKYIPNYVAICPKIMSVLDFVVFFY